MGRGPRQVVRTASSHDSKSGPSRAAVSSCPAFLGPAGEVVVDRRDARLDGRPERPADVGHDHLEAHPGEQGGGGLAEVGGAQLLDLAVVVAELLGRVAELERRVVVAAVFPVHQPQARAVVEVVLGEQVVVAGDGRQADGRRQRRLDARHLAEVLAIAGGDGDRPLVDERQVPLGDAEHVEVVPEARTGMELPRTARDPLRHPGRAQTSRSTSSGRRATRARRHPTPARSGRPVARRRPRPPRSCCGSRSRGRRRAAPCPRPGCARRTASRPRRPASSCWSARPGSARR